MVSTSFKQTNIKFIPPHILSIIVKAPHNMFSIFLFKYFFHPNLLTQGLNSEFIITTMINLLTKKLMLDRFSLNQALQEPLLRQTGFCFLH